jgi:HSP20 family protein
MSSRNRQTAFRGLFDMFAEMNRMRDQWTQAEPTAEGRAPGGAWVPAVDILALGEDLVIRCELAGIAREDVDVSLCGGQLWISGERTGTPDADQASYYVRERRCGSFRRTIDLPEGIEADRIEAAFEDGLLEIVIRGGAASARHEQIEIGGAERGAQRVDVGGG